MLISPGHSPPHIFTPAPSSSSSFSQILTLTTQAPSNPSHNPKNRGISVPDEDSYVAAIEKIIEHNIFSDIPKLRDHLDWLEAVRSVDPVLIRDAQLKIFECRRSKNPNHDPISNYTPSTSTLGFSSTTPFRSNPIPFNSDRNPNPNLEVSDDADMHSNLTLDEFFKRYTSEDNESFKKILENVNRKRKEKYSHLLEGEKEQTLTLEDVKSNARITNGYGTSGQPMSTLDGWKYTVKNLLMYNPVDRGEVPLTEEERFERLNGLTKEVNKMNTQFHGKSVAESKITKEEKAVAILYTLVVGTTPVGAVWPFVNREAESTKKYELEDLRKTPNPFFVESGKKADNGYSFVKTLSPAPGANESPFMMWEKIEGSPLRLDLEENPVGVGGSSEGLHFRIPLPPSRDLKAHPLSSEATRKLRERSKLFQKSPSPSPARGESVSPCVWTLSLAAQKFVRSAIAKSSRSMDETLCASYRGASLVAGTPKEKLSRLSRDGGFGSRSPSTRQRSPSPW